MPPKKKESEYGATFFSGTDIETLSQDLSLRENAQWAIAAAGEFLRTGQPPKECPNDSAYFMYLQATSNPKEFFAKFSQIESKVLDVSTFKRECERSIEEIGEMIDEIRYLDSMPTFLKE